MRRRVSFILPVLLSLLIAGPVRAESDTAGKSADISDRTALLQARREQLAQKRERQFRVADADHDRGLSRAELSASDLQIGRAHVGTPVTNAHLVCRLLLEKK